MFLSTIFATTFLTINGLYSLCSASPTLESKGGVAARELLTSLVGRGNRVTAPYRPTDQKCDHIAEWHIRICDPHLGDNIWFDYCTVRPGVSYAREGSCPLNKMCEDTIIQNRETIVCVDRPNSSSQVTPGQQIGVEIVENLSWSPAEHVVSVNVQSNLADATVAALMEGTDENYVVAANNAIVASLRGTTLKLCAYNATSRACIPTAPHTLTAGDTIDFTFGLSPAQEVNFYYALLSNGV